MIRLLNGFNNRETALLTWLAVVLIALLFFKPFRDFVKTALSIISSKTFIIIYSLFFIILFFILFLLKKAGVWDIHLLKDTIFWTIGVGLFLVVAGIQKDTTFFKKAAINAIKLTLVVEFFINMHVFSYVVELLILPILVLLVLLETVSENDSKYKPVNNFINKLLGIFGLFILSYGIIKTVQNYRSDFTYNNLQSLLLPTFLTIAFLPFSYLVAVYSVYEILFIRLGFLREVRYPLKEIKKSIFFTARFNLKRIKIINQKLNQFDLNETSSISEYIEKISK
jgi:hypothetical protein